MIQRPLSKEGEFMKSMKHADAGFTGLEAAIVLIAFVVVAAVFSYVVLGAGFFTTQKSQQVVHTGVQQASSTLEVTGNVYGVQLSSAKVGVINAINFSVALAPGGTPVDFTKVVLTYSNASTVINLVPADWEAAPSAGQWSVIKVEHEIAPANTLLEAGEMFDITAMPPSAIYPNDQFNIEIKPSVGPSLMITRNTPGALNLVNILY
jgi:flagellin FlaB